MACCCRNVDAKATNAEKYWNHVCSSICTFIVACVLSYIVLNAAHAYLPPFTPGEVAFLTFMSAIALAVFIKSALHAKDASFYYQRRTLSETSA